MGILNKGLSGALGSVLGYDPDDNKWFGYASDKESTLLSKDGGDTWLSTSRDTYLTSRDKASFLISKRVPWSTTNLDNPSAPHSSYQSSNWGGEYIYTFNYYAYINFIRKQMYILTKKNMHITVLDLWIEKLIGLCAF